MELKTDKKLNDVAILAPADQLNHTLEQVGLERVETMVLINGQKIKALAHASVSLIDTQARGIHMSRLFRIISQLSHRELTWDWLFAKLEEMRESHKGLSDAVYFSIEFELPVLRASLVSQQSGWRAYPLTFELSDVRGVKQGRIKTRVLYSSTCPCSAALSQQLLRDAFAEEFREERLSREQILDWISNGESLVATPHAQRSEAKCELVFDMSQTIGEPIEYIDLVEGALGTPVQTAVKREDEQEFARLNAGNLMFCEDAARKLKTALNSRKELADFVIEVRHFESLHPHDVVARARK